MGGAYAHPLRHRARGEGRAAAGAALALVLALALALAGRPPVPPAATATASPPAGPVELPGLRTETSRTFANPDGTRTLVASATPQSVRRPDGTWTALDTTLRRQAGGSWAPAADGADVHFSAGGAAPLATFSTGAAAFGLSWPGPLPAPAIAGDTALYRGVLPGVDLRVRAVPGGFSTVLVVTSPSAAADPALRSIRYRWSGHGLLARPRPDGGIDVVDPAGTVAAGAGAAAMWDSAGGGDAAGPGDGARQATLPLRVDGDGLALTPDPALLAAGDLTFPLYIDPTITKTPSPWAYADSTNSNNGDGIARVGLDPSGSGVYRSFFAFDTRALARTHIRSATFKSLLVHSWACTSTPVDLYRTDNLASGTGNDARAGWSGPALREWANEQSGHAHKPSGGAGCSNDPQPDVTLSFGGSLTGIVQTHATSGDATMTFALSERQQSGSGESTQSWWKKFSPTSTSLTVDYDSFPAAPTGLATSPASPCLSGASRPVLNASSGVALSAYLSDPDGGNLVGRFAWKKVGDPDPGSALPATASQASGTRFTTAGGIPAASLADGQSYAWRVQGDDGTVTGAFSRWCEFTVDDTPPAGPPAIQSADLAAFPQPAPATAVVGRPAVVRFTPAPGDADVTGYWYGVAVGTPSLSRFVAAGPDGSATATVTPPQAGVVLSLAAQEVDRAGNRSATAPALQFLAGPASGWWPTTATAAAALTDASGQGHDVALQGGASVAHGAVTLPGAPAAGVAGGPAIADTTGSFTIAAWARLGGTAASQAVASQDGAQESAFVLGYRADAGAWCMSVQRADAAGTASDQACAATPPVTGTWTHLAGEYDAAAQQVVLFVDGVQAAAAPAPQVWTAQGSFALGRALDAGAPAQPFAGDLADVRAWPQAMDQPALAALAASPPAAGRWDFDDSTANSAADLSGVSPGHPLTTSATGAVVTGGGASGGALVLDGVAGSARTSGAAIRTDQSFTVAARVRLQATGGAAAMAVGAAGTNTHAFHLGYLGSSNQWTFRTVPTDAVNAGGSTLASTTATPAAGTWTELTGVWDAPAKQMRLYVDGVLQSQATVGVPFAAAGPLTVGCDWVNGANAEFLDGQVDDVRIYQGVLSAAQIAALAAG